MTLSLIVAVSQNGVIGANNRLPWHLPADLKRFKQLTMGRPILMGRKTFESIGKPLPGRANIVITRRKEFNCCGTTAVPSLEKGLELCADQAEAFVIGGAQIFEQALPLANRIYLTRIGREIEGDTFFRWDESAWRETARQEPEPDAQNPLPYTFLTYERK